MNDENEKPKDDDWGMTMPHLRDETGKTTEGFSVERAPNSGQTPDRTTDDGWGMTAPNLNIQKDYSPSSEASDFGKTAPNLNLAENDWQEKTPPIISPDDWGMNTASINPVAENTPDEWEMNDSVASPPPPPPPKKSEWSMPTPIFRVSEGENIDEVKKTAAFKLSDLQGFDLDTMSFRPRSSTAPSPDPFDKPAPGFNFHEQKPPTVPNDFAAAPPIISEMPPPVRVAEPLKSSEKKKTSKTPYLVGGLLTVFLFAGGLFAAVYFLLLDKPVETASEIESPKSEETSAVSASPASLAVAPSPNADLPKQIEYKGTMLLVAAGEFTMGSDTGAEEAIPAHKIVLPAFYIDKTEVTNAAYKVFCDATGKLPPPNPHIEKDYFTTRPNAPVVGVSFADAKNYADWAGKRLPTEAEWEKAASWDEATKTKREFPWGNDFQKDKAAFGTAQISDVGKFSDGASPSGALDMAGNVLEWVDAFFQPYPNGSSSNPEFGEKNRVVRGGHFASKSSDSLKTGKRIYIPPTVASGEDGEKLVAAIIGFRCAMSGDAPAVAALRTQGK